MILRPPTGHIFRRSLESHVSRSSYPRACPGFKELSLILSCPSKFRLDGHAARPTITLSRGRLGCQMDFQNRPTPLHYFLSIHVILVSALSSGGRQDIQKRSAFGLQFAESLLWAKQQSVASRNFNHEVKLELFS